MKKRNYHLCFTCVYTADGMGNDTAFSRRTG